MTALAQPPRGAAGAEPATRPRRSPGAAPARSTRPLVGAAPAGSARPLVGAAPAGSARPLVGAPHAALRGRDGVTVLVLDREEVTLCGFAFLFARQSWVGSCVVASHPARAREQARAHPPGLALLDASWGRAALTELVADLRELRPDVRVVTLGALGDGVPAVMKTWPAAALMRAVKAALESDEGVGWPAAERPDRLSERERQVLTLVARGATNREIGEQLFLSPHTIKQHTRSAYRKLAARNRADAVTRARTLGLLAG
jgi:two-component system response regulator DesR